LSFLYFSFVALYDEINSVSFLFFAMVALYDHIFKVSLAPSLYAIFKVLSMLFYLTALEKATASPKIRISSSSWF